MQYKRRRPTPHFKIPPPFNAVTGQYASLTGELGVFPYCVLMQVAAEDTYTDYVICRGFDTRMLVFVDYEAGNSDKPGISVAKPYGRRKAGLYAVGEIYPALLPVQGNATYTPPSPSEIGLRLGQNPGEVSGDTVGVGGQPGDLDASLEILYDHNGVAVNWLIIDSGVNSDVCEDIHPGSYRAVAGETIEPGETGLILITTCDGTQAVEAVNHTDCPFYVGNRITANVDPCCVVHFTGCGGSTEPLDPGDPGFNCCELGPFFVCFNGMRVMFFLNGGVGDILSYFWGPYYTDSNNPTEKCDICLHRGTESAPGWYANTWGLSVTVTCVAGVITATWQYWCNPGFYVGDLPVSPPLLIDEGTLDWSDLCNNPPDTYEDIITVDGCDMTLFVSRYLIEFPNCDFEPSPADCCDKELWLCLNNESVQRSVDGGNYTWTVTDCCEDCSGVATLEATLQCSNGVVSLTTEYICDGGTPQVQTTTLSPGVCNSTAPITVNIATSTCFLQLQINHGSFALGCYECPVPSVPTSCCVDDVPETLSAVVVGGACPGTYPLLWVSGTTWSATLPCATIEFVCTAGTWSMSYDTGFPIGLMLTSAACDPFQVVFDGTAAGITSVTVT